MGPRGPFQPHSMWSLQAGTCMEQVAHIVGSQGFGLPRRNVELSRGALKILFCRYSLLLKVKSPTLLHLAPCISQALALL